MGLFDKFQEDIYNSAKSRFLKLKRSQKIALAVAIALAVLGYAGYSSFWKNRIPKFSDDGNDAGILVLRINGDTEDNNLQLELVSALNSELIKSPTKGRSQIKARAYDEGVSEVTDIDEAHNDARKMGKRQKAILVIWGTRAQEKKFFPRITIVEKTPRLIITTERTLQVQNISELKLPPEIVTHPIYLTHFAVAYTQYYQNKYDEAIERFETLIKSLIRRVKRVI